MKRMIKMQTLMAAFVVAATSVSARAADANTNTLSATSSDRTLGKVERADKIIGREVRSNNNQKIGKIEDFAVDLESGRVIYAVVSVGGFLGIGDRNIAVPTSAFTEHGKQLRLDVDKQKLMDAPQLSKDDTNQLTPSFASQVNKFFGQGNAWWENSAGESGAQFGNVHRASDLNGMDVQNTSNQKIADVENVAIDLTPGRVAYVIISPDSSLNLKDNLYALPPNALTPSADGKSLTTDLDAQKLASAPHLSKNEWSKLSDHSFASQVYQYYGKQPYFDNSLQPTSSGTNSQERIYHEPQNSNP